MQDATVSLQLDIVEFKARLTEAEKRMKEFGDRLGGIEKTNAVQAIGAIVGGIRHIGDRIGEVNPTAGRFISTLTDIGTTAAQTTAMFGPLVGGIVAAGQALVEVGVLTAKFMQESVSKAGDFEVGMDKVSTIVDTTTYSMDTFNKGILALSSQVIRSSGDLAEGLYQVISANVSVADSMGVLEVAAKAATAGYTSTEVAVDGLTSVLNAYHLPASKALDVTDMMFKSVEKGKLEFEDIAGAIGHVAPIAATLGIEFGDLMAVLTTLTQSGTGFSEAVTAVRQLLTETIDPSSRAAEAAKSLGIEFSTSAIKSKGLVGFLGELREKAAGNETQLGKLISGVEALNSVMALTGKGGDDLVKVFDDISRSAGTTEAQFAKVADGYNKQMELLMIQVDNLKITIGEELLPVLTEFLKGVNENFGEVKEIFADLTAMVKDLIPLFKVLKGLQDVSWAMSPIGLPSAFSRIAGGIIGRQEAGVARREAGGELVAETFRAGMPRGMETIAGVGVSVPTTTRQLTEAELKAIEKIEDETIKVRQRTAEITASLAKEQVDRDTALLETKYNAEVENIQRRVAAIKGSGEAQTQLREALNSQLRALDEKYYMDYDRLIEKYISDYAKEIDIFVVKQTDAEGEVLYAKVDAFNKATDAHRRMLEDQARDWAWYMSIGEETRARMLENALKIETATEQEIARNAEHYHQEEQKRYQEALEWVKKHQQARLTAIVAIEREEGMRIFAPGAMEKSDEELNNFIKSVSDATDEIEDTVIEAFINIGDSFEQIISSMPDEWQKAANDIVAISESASAAVSGNWLEAASKSKNVWLDFAAWLAKQFEPSENIMVLNQRFNELFNQMNLEQQQQIEKAMAGQEMTEARYRGFINWMEQETGQERTQWRGRVETDLGIPRTRPERYAEEPQGRFLRGGITAEEAVAEARQAGQAVQISQITGPTRDLLVGLLTPLKNLNVLPPLLEGMKNAIYDMRDAMLGTKVPRSPDASIGEGVGTMNVENLNVNVKSVADVTDMDALNRNLSDAARRERRLLGRRK